MILPIENTKMGRMETYRLTRRYLPDAGALPHSMLSFALVLEHVPCPIEALRNGAYCEAKRLLITAPLGSGLPGPYHFYGGYTEDWYRKFLATFGCEIVEVSANHGFFANLAQECCRFAWTFEQHKAFHGAHGADLCDFMLNLLAPYLYAMDGEVSIPEFTVGFHVEARRKASET